MQPSSTGAAAASYKGRWFITGLGVGQIVSWGTFFYTFPLIAEPMGQELALTKPEVYAAASIGLACAGLASYPVGAAVDRGQGRAVMAFGSALGGLLFMAWSQVTSLWVFYALFVGIGVVQAMTLYEPAFAIVARRFRENARGGITALTLWGGVRLDSLCAPDAIAGRPVWMAPRPHCLGLINLGLCASLYAVTINPKTDPPPLRPIGADTVEVLSGRKAVYWAFGQPVFWGILISIALYLGIQSGLIFHLYPLLLERGYDTATTVAALAIIGPAQVAGRVIIWLLASSATIRMIGMITVLLFPVGLALLFLDSLGFLAPALFALIYGAANGVFTIVRGTAVPEMLTRDAYGAINGTIAAPAFILRAVAPVAVALLWSSGGSYSAVLVGAIAGTAFVAVAFWFAALSRAPKSRLPDPPTGP